MDNQQVNFNTALYNCATECALRRLGHRCKKENFDSIGCESCTYNITHYINANPQHVKLFMMEAENRAARIRHRSSLPKVLIAFILIVTAIFIGASVITKKQQDEFRRTINSKTLYVQ